MKTHQKQQGFTLIEMIVTVSIAAILASIAVPSFTKMIERNRVSSGTNEFLSALILARSEAVKRSENISICTSQDQASCAAATHAEYATGWIVFTDCDTDGILDDAVNVCDTTGDGVADSFEIPIKVHEELPKLSILSAGAPNVARTTYDPSGRSANFNFNIGKDSGTITKKIEVSRTGRVKSVTIH